MTKVIVGMSGGVDSAVAAYLLKEAGYEVVGLTLRSWMSDDGDEGRCCEIDDARAAARKLQIPYHTLNCESAFRENVTEPFVQAYLRGQTPNPCIECNRYVKWERMLYMAKVLHADRVATGHYASVIRLDNGRYTVRTADHAEKDQTYMLYRLTQEQLQATLMPLGGYSKQEVREIAAKAGIPVAQKPDSQEICFVPDNDYAGYIEQSVRQNAGQNAGRNAVQNAGRNAGKDAGRNAAEIPGPGNFVNEAGEILGQHKGIIHYTIGQRKGLGIALGTPAYVKSIRPDTNEVVLAEDAALYRSGIICGRLNYMGIPELLPGEKIRCKAKIRYHHTAQEAEIEQLTPDSARIVFDRTVRAPAPGQSAVFYDDDGCVLGGGIITESF